jgi:hypothetical protein
VFKRTIQNRKVARKSVTYLSRIYMTVKTFFLLQGIIPRVGELLAKGKNITTAIFFLNPSLFCNL